MMAGNPNLRKMYVHHPPYYHQPQPPPPPQAPSLPPPSTLLSSSSPGSPHFFHPQFVVGSSPLVQPLHNPSSFSDNDIIDHGQLPHSWSQLLLGGLSNEEVGNFQTGKLGNWESEEDEILSRTPVAETPPPAIDVKGEVASPSIRDSNNNAYTKELSFPTVMRTPSWTHIMMPVSSPTSCVTSLSSGNVWDFSKTTKEGGRNLNSDHSSECNSTATGGACKKARVHPPSTQPPLKVRKEKLGDRITALHQLVSPFGKTDTASVLLEAIGYIGFLQGQIEALSSPYLRNNDGSGNVRSSNLHSVPGEANYAFSGDALQDSHDHKPKDLSSRGLCLVPVSCMAQVGNENGADYWAPAFRGGF